MDHLSTQDPCTHETTALRIFTFSDGTEHFVRQCCSCHEKATAWLRHDLVSPEEAAGATPFDHDALTRHRVLDRQRVMDARPVLGSLRDDPQYQEYLRSPKWAEIRALVLYRDNGMCRGCGKRRGCDVHHLSYAHLYDEFLFELVTVCRSCHDRWHDDG